MGINGNTTHSKKEQTVILATIRNLKNVILSKISQTIIKPAYYVTSFI